MFTITSTRIVGLIAVVCAAIVAPQALAMPIIDSQDATPTIIAPPGNEPSGLDLGDLKNGRALFTAATPDAVQGNDLSGLDPSVLNGIRAYQQHEEYLRGRAQAALAAAGQHKNVKAASTAAAIKALQRRSVALDAAYRKLYPGAYRHGSMQTNPGWGAAATAAKKSAATLAVKTAPAGLPRPRRRPGMRMVELESSRQASIGRLSVPGRDALDPGTAASRVRAVPGSAGPVPHQQDDSMLVEARVGGPGAPLPSRVGFAALPEPQHRPSPSGQDVCARAEELSACAGPIVNPSSKCSVRPGASPRPLGRRSTGRPTTTAPLDPSRPHLVDARRTRNLRARVLIGWQ